MNEPKVVKRKKRYVIKPQPQAPRPTQFLSAVGQFPEININHEIWLAGPIQLFYGEHRQDGGGYGFRHIWEDHFWSITSESEALATVLDFLKTVLVAGAQIYYEHALGAMGNRVVVLRTPHGMAVLERRQAKNIQIYSVVSAYFRTKPTGYQVGSLE